MSIDRVGNFVATATVDSASCVSPVHESVVDGARELHFTQLLNKLNQRRHLQHHIVNTQH